MQSLSRINITFVHGCIQVKAKVAGRLDHVLADVKTTGASLCNDAYTDNSQRPLMNFMLVTPKGAAFQSSVDLSEEIVHGNPDAKVQKDAVFVADAWDKAIKAVGKEDVVCIITDSAAVNEKAASLLLAEHKASRFVDQSIDVYCHVSNCQPLFSGTRVNTATSCGCAAARMPSTLPSRTLVSCRGWQSLSSKHATWCASLPTTRPHVRFCGNTLSSTCSSQVRCSLCWNTVQHASYNISLVTLAGDTRFGTNFLMLGRLVEVHQKLKQMVADDKWHAWEQTQKNTSEAAGVRNLINQDSFWVLVEGIVEAVTPMMSLLRLVDSPTPCMGKVYNNCFLVGEALAASRQIKVVQRQELVEIWQQRWVQCVMTMS